MKNEETRKKIDELKTEIERKKKEIEALMTKVEELNAKMQKNSETQKVADMRSVIKEATDLLGFSLDLLGFSLDLLGKVPTADSGVDKGGLIGLIDGLARLAERSDTLEKGFEVAGRRGVVDFRVTSRPIKGSVPSHVGLGHGKALSRGGPRELHLPSMADAKDEGAQIVDIVEAEEEVTVLVDLPGLDGEDIKWEVEDGKLRINVVTSDSSYSKEIVLPSDVERNGSKYEYQNGVFKVILKKKKQK
jgi:HSP20 family molecular chaperone IbpA